MNCRAGEAKELREAMAAWLEASLRRAATFLTLLGKKWTSDWDRVCFESLGDKRGARSKCPLRADSVEKGSSCDARHSLIQLLREAGLKIMMGHRQVDQAALFYEFSLERHVPADHLRSEERRVGKEC